MPVPLLRWISRLQKTPESPAAAWFKASEDLGDDIGIRFGCVSMESDQVEWFSVSHYECDGVGAFARLLRQSGAELPELPRSKNPHEGILGPLWWLFGGRPKPSECATRLDWACMGDPPHGAPNPTAWHMFTKEETQRIVDACRRQKVTVNSLLLKHLDAAVRPELDITKAIPWMIPVNLRGDVNYADDTENHVSCIDVPVFPDDTASQLHQRIHLHLSQGEHRANHLLMRAGRLLGHRLKVWYLRQDRARPAGSIGAFSNLGAWDAAEKIPSTDRWLFCPPVVLGQRLSAGCLTFQNRLSLMIQTHPHGPDVPGYASTWMSRWVEGIGKSMA